MPWIEKIPSIEDREFISSLGNWTGDFYWEPGPYYGQSGLMEAFLSVPYKEYDSKLLYPAFRAPAGTYIRFKWMLGQNVPPVAIDTFWIKLFDGVLYVTPYYSTWTTIGPWQYHTDYFLTPSTWNKNLGRFWIHYKNGPYSTAKMRYDNLSAAAWELPKADHLPLMGVH